MAGNDDDRDGSKLGALSQWKLAPTLLEQVPRASPEEIQAFFDRTFVSQHFAALGYVAAAWAEFEASVDWWLWFFAEMRPEVGVCFTGQMIGPRPRIDAFVALVRHLGVSKNWNAKLDDFANDARKLGEGRNRALHDVWDMTNPQLPQRREATARGTVRYLSVHQPTEKLISLVKHIHDLTAKFEITLADAICDELYPSLRTIPPEPDV